MTIVWLVLAFGVGALVGGVAAVVCVAVGASIEAQRRTSADPPPEPVRADALQTAVLAWSPRRVQ